MDWVVNGQKYLVDYNFGMIDVDSIMGRIEASKESLRNATIPDADGAGEVYGVSLTPSRWATYCKLKAEGWYKRNGRYTLAQLDSEIARLQNLLESYELVSTMIVAKDEKGKLVKSNTYPIKGATAPTSNRDELKKDVTAKLKLLYEAQAALSGAVYNLEQDATDAGSTHQATVDTAKGKVTAAQKDLKDAEDKFQSAQKEWAEYNRATMEGNMFGEATGWLTKKTTTIKDEISRLQELRKKKVDSEPVEIPVIAGVTVPSVEEKKTDESKGKGSEEPGQPQNGEGGTNPPKKGVGEDKPALQGSSNILATKDMERANPVFKSPNGTGNQPPNSAEDADPWTTISFSYTAQDIKNHSTESEWGMKVGGQVGFGLWSVGGSYSHDESHKSVQKDMAACDVSISFSALVVNIRRPWLYGELFSDVDLEVANDKRLSPGPILLNKMIQEQKVEDIAMWSQFPAYPTSFIVAADTTIEFTGATKHIEDHFDTHSNSGGASVGYGPWSVSSSSHESATEQSMQVHSTATGCKITFGAPQVIAWVSQILPPLPRPANYNPLTQGAGFSVS